MKKIALLSMMLLVGCGYNAPETHPIPRQATDYGWACLQQGYEATYHWSEAFDPTDNHEKTTMAVECSKGAAFFLDGRKLP